MKKDTLNLETIEKMSMDELNLFLKNPENLRQAISLVKHEFTETVWQDDLWCVSLRSEDETPLKYKLEAISNYSVAMEEKIPLQENKIGWLNYGFSNETIIKYVRSVLPEDNNVIVEKNNGKYLLKITTRKSDRLDEREVKKMVANKFHNIVLL